MGERTPVAVSFVIQHASSAIFAACFIPGRKSRGGKPDVGDASKAKAWRAMTLYKSNGMFVQKTHFR
jgi:hypothetical protein